MLRSIRFTALLLPAVILGTAACVQQNGMAQAAAQPAAQAADAPAATSNQNKPAAASLPAAPLPDAPVATAQAAPAVQPTGPTAVIDTTMGQMTCRLFSSLAPKTVANFVGLATGRKNWTNPVTHKKMHDTPLYNGTTFHRVIPGFMIQGGDPAGNGSGSPGYYIDDEFSPNLDFTVPGRLAMANSGPNTDGSQFFITLAPQPSLDQHYTIFGQCSPDSLLVAETIAQVPRDTRDKPIDPVVIQKVTIMQSAQAVPAPPAHSTATTHP
jgi:peptidyl-prolyl cis-trans isomerase A (cyclophilin A)